MKFCPECGKPVTEGSQFCSNCGANLEDKNHQEMILESGLENKEETATNRIEDTIKAAKQRTQNQFTRVGSIENVKPPLHWLKASIVSIIVWVIVLIIDSVTEMRQISDSSNALDTVGNALSSAVNGQGISKTSLMGLKLDYLNQSIAPTAKFFIIFIIFIAVGIGIAALIRNSKAHSVV